MSAEAAERERRFHDAWAREAEAGAIDVRAAFEASTAPENRFIVGTMGELAGRRLLDVGCGLGESAVYFAGRGAIVTALDLSPGMVELTCELGRRHGVSIDGIVSSATELDVPEGAFDLAYLGNVLHHVPRDERVRVFEGLRRALRPGGRFFSWDPISGNPAIDVYRRMATDVRTVDEEPLTFADVARARASFPDVKHREFWILSLALFGKYYLVDRVHPNQDRYWKRILREPEDRLGWFRALQSADALLTRIPGVRRLAWNMVMWGARPAVP